MVVAAGARDASSRYRDRVTLADVSPSRPRAARRAGPLAAGRRLRRLAGLGALDGGGVWIVRRLALRVLRFPRLLEPVEVATFCSGVAPLWAERSSLVTSGGEPVAEAVALWVHLQPDGTPPDAAPRRASTPSTARRRSGRRVRARLQHPAAPPAGAPARPWRFRGADLDLAGHVNNAVYWEALEDELVDRDPRRLRRRDRAPRAGRARAGRRAGRTARMRWITDAAGAVVATLELARLAAARAGERRAPVLDRGGHRRCRSPRRPPRRRRGAPTWRTCRRSAPRPGRSRSPGRTARRAGSARRARRPRAGDEREVDHVAELVQHDGGAVVRAVAVEAQDVEVDGEAALVAAGDAERRPSRRRRSDLDEAVDLGDQPRRLGPRARRPRPGSRRGRPARRRGRSAGRRRARRR